MQVVDERQRDDTLSICIYHPCSCTHDDAENRALQQSLPLMQFDQREPPQRTQVMPARAATWSLSKHKKQRDSISLACRLLVNNKKKKPKHDQAKHR